MRYPPARARLRRPALVTDAPGAAPALARRASRSHGRSDKRTMQGGVQARECCAPEGTSHATGGRMLVINEDLLGPEAIAAIHHGTLVILTASTAPVRAIIAMRARLTRRG